MIIELFGLPGSGKTTLAKRIETDKKIPVIKINKKRELIFLNLVFLFRHPFKFFWSLFYLMKYAGGSNLFYYKFLNIFLHHNAKYLKAKKQRIAIIDQGHFQNVLSLFERPVSGHALLKYLNCLPKPDKLIVLDLNPAEIKNRFDSRGYYSRADMSVGYQEKWLATIAVNYATFLRVIKDIPLNYLIIDASRDIGGIYEEFKKDFGKTKVIYIANARIPTEKGHGRQIAKMCEQFGLVGLDAELWIPTRQNPISQDLFDYYGLKKGFVVKKIKCFDFICFAKYLGPLSVFLQNLNFVRKIFFKKISSGVIIYTRSQEIAWLAKKRGFKTFYECHEWFGRRKWLMTRFIKKADGIITTNRFIGQEFVNRGYTENKIFVAPNGVDLDIFGVDMDKQKALLELFGASDIYDKLSGKKILVYTGSFKVKGVEKGIREILNAMKKINREDLVFLAVGGSGQDIDYYKEMADGLGISNRVYFFGHQNQQKLAIFQQASDILLMPFPKIAHYEYYMNPLKTFEYMASYRPIIASSLPSLKEYLNDDNCLFCEPGNSDDLAEKIKKLFEDQVLSQRIATRAREDSKHYAWQRRAEKIKDFISRK